MEVVGGGMSTVLIVIDSRDDVLFLGKVRRSAF
jgi:hypothetical protein